jgi:hypothetical protein
MKTSTNATTLTVMIVMISISVGAFTLSARAQGLVGLFELEEGARPAAMGGAFVGLADDGHALFYNPAGLAFLQELHVNGLFQSRFSRVSYGTFSFAVPDFGAEFLFLNIGGLTRRDEMGVPEGELPYKQIGVLLGGGLALNAPPLDLDLPLAAGLQLKIYRVSTLTPGSGTAFSLTPSFLWSQERLELGGLPLRTLRFGLIAPNLLSLGITYGSGHRESWGPGLRVGAAAVLSGGLTFALDFEANGTFHIGGEWQLSGLGVESLGNAELALRLGLSNAGSVLTPSVGFGLRVADFRVDYAFVMHSTLPGTHRIEFSAVFGPPNALLCSLRPDTCPPDDPIEFD